MTILTLLPFLPCLPPRGLALQIRNSSIARTARGRCGHDIATRHTLHAGPNGPMIHDSVAAKDPGRNRHGARPLGPLGFFTGRSIHECDGCARKKELALSVVCTTCGCSVPPGASVGLIRSGLVRHIAHERFRGLATTTLDGTKTVVCGPCVVGRFGHDSVTLRWMGSGVMHERSYATLVRAVARQAA